jgi:hypothetical protein
MRITDFIRLGKRQDCTSGFSAWKRRKSSPERSFKCVKKMGFEIGSRKIFFGWERFGIYFVSLIDCIEKLI